MPSAESEHVWWLKFHNSNLRREVEAFKNGSKYQKLCNDYDAVIRELNATIKKLRVECADAHAHTITVRNIWIQTVDDLEEEHAKELKKANSKIETLEEKLLAAEQENEKLRAQLKKERLEKYQLGEQLEDANGTIKKLTAQVNKDFENSSIPSSKQGAARKKIPNSREKTGRKPGAQPGHKGAGRKKQIVDNVVVLDDPEEYVEDANYYKTGDVLKRQCVEINVVVSTTEYQAYVWRNRTTGTRVHAKFPVGVVNDVNYGGSIKALAFVLGNECNVSHYKVSRFIEELTGGKLKISVGMINGLCEEISAKTVDEKRKIIESLMTSPAMNADFTNANVGGNGKQVLILASEQNGTVLYIGKETKGHKGIIGTPLENYVGTVIHDHDKTFYSYGQKHQECHQHNIRYIKGSIENEPELEWSKKMLDLIREMLHYRNTLGNSDLDEPTVNTFEKRYDDILDLAENEYLDNPPSDYYKDGYNLYKRLREYRDSELLFLHNKSVSANNSLCERLARSYKRKQKQVIAFRSFQNLQQLCDALSIVYSLRQTSKNVYEEISNIYRKPRSYPKARPKKSIP